MSNILSVRPIFYRSGIKSPKIIGNFYRSAGPTSLKKCRSGRIFVGPGPTVFIFSGVILKCVFTCINEGRARFPGRPELQGHPNKSERSGNWGRSLFLMGERLYFAVMLFAVTKNVLFVLE